MPECQNCGTQVSHTYARVFSRRDSEDPLICPHCEDMTRDAFGRARRKRSQGGRS